MGGSPFARLRRIVTGKAVELAFRRYLDDQGIPYDNLGTTPFTDPDRYDVALGGHRCDIKSFQVFRKETIHRIRRDPAVLLQASALVPSDQLASTHLSDDDLYIFAFATALVTAHQAELGRVLAAGKPTFLIHPLLSRWTRPPQWASLGRLVFKNEAGPPISLELGGQNANKDFQTEEVILSPGKRTYARGDFYSLAYLRSSVLPAGRVGVYSPTLDETYVVESHEWGNIWIYGMDIFLTGWATRGEFRQRAVFLPSASRVWQYAQTRTQNHALMIAELSPLPDLFTRVKEWSRITQGR
jgi:hypothetical protein